MSSLPVFPTLPGLTYTVLKTPEFNTLVMSAPNRYEVRIQQEINPTWSFTLIYDFLHDFFWGTWTSVSELRTLMGFFTQMGGKASSFLFTDPDDSNVGPALATTAWMANNIYQVGQGILDSANHWQKVTAITTGISGGTIPTFNHSGGNTGDGGVTWADEGAYSSAGFPNTFFAGLPLVTDGLGNWFSPIQRTLNGIFFEDVTDLNGAITVYQNGVLASEGISAGNYQIAGPGLALPTASYMGLYLAWVPGTGFASWTASHAYLINAEIIDPAGHIQKVTRAGTSGATIPFFNDSGGSTNDGLTALTITMIQRLATAWSITVSSIGDLQMGDVTTFAGLTTDPSLNGTSATVATIVGNVFTFTAASATPVAITAETGTATFPDLIWADQGYSPAPGGPVTAEFNFYFRVRFDSDSQDFEKFLSTGSQSAATIAGQGGGIYTIGGSEAQNGSGTLRLTTARPTPL